MNSSGDAVLNPVLVDNLDFGLVGGVGVEGVTEYASAYRSLGNGGFNAQYGHGIAGLHIY